MESQAASQTVSLNKIYYLPDRATIKTSKLALKKGWMQLLVISVKLTIVTTILAQFKSNLLTLAPADQVKAWKAFVDVSSQVDKQILLNMKYY